MLSNLHLEKGMTALCSKYPAQVLNHGKLWNCLIAKEKQEGKPGYDIDQELTMRVNFKYFMDVAWVLRRIWGA